ncbi:MAG: hypothetical protein ABIG44_05705 [Planctomycetota bacterium]
MKKLLVCLAVAGMLCGGCNSPSPRVNAPPHGTAEETNDMQGLYVYMTDAALLENMTICDIHFHPHRSLLNTLGEQRLSRLASLMDVYGGTIRYSTNLQDKVLLASRTEAIIAFLQEAGVDTSTDILQHDLPGGRGMDASEVILIKANEGTYQPGKSSSGSSAGATSGSTF